MPNSMVQKVNDYALRALRDIANRDYILARMAYRARLYPKYWTHQEVI